MAMQGRRKLPEWNGRALPEAEYARSWMAENFADAELYWVSPEMTDVIIAMAPTIPDCLPQVPVKTAFVVFGRSIPGTDAEDGGEIHTSAFLWGEVELFKVGACLDINSYAWRDQVAAYSSLPEKLQARWREVMPSRLMPTGGSQWPYHALLSDFSSLGDEAGTTMTNSMVEDRRILATFWALCSQRIAIETRERPSRQQQRRAQREGRKLDEIRVIRLREPASHSATSSRDTEWSHRWIVGSHWRNQWYAKDQTHRPKLIEAYVKGPEDKPLKIRETVRALVR
jgi:hypothetical protein